MDALRHTAFGKVILLGEHAVVYGVPALCGALRSGVVIDIDSAGAAADAPPGSGLLRVPAWGVATPPIFEDGADAGIGRAYGALLAALGLRGQRFDHDFTVRFDIPTSAGLGSSAALAVALARAVGAVAGLALAPEQVAAAALAAEEVFHGRPSGLDHTVAQLGGFGLFRRGAGLAPLAAPPLPLCIGQTGRARDTRGRVARVAALREEQPARTAAAFASIAALVTQGADAVSRGDLPALGRAMDENQALLGALEVSCPEIDEMCRLARDAGALGAKLTGGGGGGCVIALSPGREAAVQARWREAGYTSFLTTVGNAEEQAA